MSLIHIDNNCLHITYVGKQCLFQVFWLQAEVNVPVFEMCAEGCWHRESAWTCVSGQHMNLSWRKTEWLPSSWLRNAGQGSPDFRVSLLLVLFRDWVAFIFQRVARRRKVTALRRKTNNNLGILYLPFLPRAVSNCEAVPQPTPSCAGMFQTISAYLFTVLIYLYSCIQSSSRS